MASSSSSLSSVGSGRGGGSGGGSSAATATTTTTTSSSSQSQRVSGSVGSGDTTGPSPWDTMLGDGEDGEVDRYQGEEEFYYSNKDSVIFLVDASPAMMEVNERGEVPFQNAVKCAIATMTDKIISSESDLLGVCFYGTRAKKNLNDFEGIYVLQDLDVPDAQRIIELEALVGAKRDFPFGHFGRGDGGGGGGGGAEFPFGDALWTCSTMFSNCTVKVGHKRVFLFTNEDNPNGDAPALRDQALQRAKDLEELGIEIELFSMPKAARGEGGGGGAFDASRFYQTMLSFADDEDLAAGQFNFDASAKFEELRARVRRKEFKKRALTRLPFIVGGGLEMAVRLYNLVQETKKGSFEWLDSRTNQPVKTSTRWVCAETGSLLLDSQIKLTYTYGGERVVFTREEMADIKTIDSPGLRLMGFKPRAALKCYHNIKHASFIYPDEHHTRGSTVAFAALLAKMLQLGKIAIARLTPRKGMPPRFVALLPQEEIFDRDNAQATPPGMHVIPLPYADDIREIHADAAGDVPKDAVQRAKRITKSLRIKFSSADFENPSLQKHYAGLQALALDRDEVEDTPDYVNPDTAGMARFQPLIDDFVANSLPAGYDPEAALGKKKGVAGVKRAAVDADGNPVPPKPPVELPDDVDWAAACRSGGIRKYTIPILKEYIKRNIPGVRIAALKKDELIHAIMQHHGVGEDELPPPAKAARRSRSEAGGGEEDGGDE